MNRGLTFWIIAGIMAMVFLFSIHILATEPTFINLMHFGFVAGVIGAAWLVASDAPGESSRMDAMLDSDKITIRINLGKLRVGALFIVAIGIFGAGMTDGNGPEEMVLFFSGLLVGITGIAILLYTFRLTGIVLYMDEKGIGNGLVSHPLIPWNDLDAIWIDKYKGQERLHLRALDKEPTKMFAKPDGIMLQQIYLNVSLERVKEAAERLREKYT